jgi:hypothetical protein
LRAELDILPWPLPLLIKDSIVSKTLPTEACNWESSLASSSLCCTSESSVPTLKGGKLILCNSTLPPFTFDSSQDVRASPEPHEVGKESKRYSEALDMCAILCGTEMCCCVELYDL